jgi:hypothetical protein
VRAFLFLVAAIGVGALASACLDCRPVETRDLGIDCSGSSTFRGELHLDSAETWRTFLTDRCLTDDGADIDAAVAAVDFSTEAVFVARGARSSVSRCIVGRAVETVDACGDGLKIVFADDENGDAVCPGDWTVAFTLPREDLRSALAD